MPLFEATDDPTPRYFELSSGLIVPESCIPRRPKAVDLFSGCGGMSLGIIQSGFEVVAGFDSDPCATLTYLANLGAHPCSIHFVQPDDSQRLNKTLEKRWGMKDRQLRDRNNNIAEAFTSGSGWLAEQPAETPGVGHFWFGDIRQIRGKDVLRTLGMERGELDLVAGSPPCQGFSTANTKRHKIDPRNSLVSEWARMVIELLPKTVIFENVPGMLQMVTPAGIPVIDELCRILEDGGFGCVDSFRKSLQAQTGIGRMCSKKKERKSKERRPNRSPQQPALIAT